MALCLAAAAAGSDDLRMLGRSDDQKLIWVDTQAIASLAIATARAVSDDSIKLGRSDDQKTDTVGRCLFVHPKSDG